MGKVLVVRKTDKTIHVVPLGNKAILMGMNHRLPATHKMKLEVMEESEALKLPFIDPNYVSPSQAQDKLKAVEGELQEKDSQIADLQAKIDALMAQQTTKTPEPSKPLTAAELIDAIGKAETAEAVQAYMTEGETRVTVLNAITKRLSELEAK